MFHKFITNLMLKLLIVILLLVRVSQLSKKPGDLANKKCIEYSKFVYTDELSPVLHVDRNLESISKCGVVEVPLIIGGVKAAEIEFPHMAVIGFGQDINDENLAWHCGGTLISEEFILTAAHCVSHRERGDAQRVRLGVIDLSETNNDDDNIQEIKIGKRLIHPEYSGKSKYNDIALLKLIDSVVFNGHVRPACLNTDPHFGWTKSLATGFGKLSYESEDGSPNLMKVQLSNINISDCLDTYKGFRGMTNGIIESQFCAGELAGRRDTCQGDSGGPLQTILNEPYCMYNIIGITSFGKFCGFEKSPGIYTRVASFTEWIEQNVWK